MLKQVESGECQRNHAGTAGGMESAGALTAFQHSVERDGLQYLEFSWGWRQSFTTVSDNIYPGVEIKKNLSVAAMSKNNGETAYKQSDGIKKDKICE